MVRGQAAEEEKTEWRVKQSYNNLIVILTFTVSLKLIHFGDSFRAVVFHELKPILVQFFQQCQNSAKNIFVAAVRVVLSATLLASCCGLAGLGLLCV